MKVVRVVAYHKDLQLDEAPEPKITSSLDVIVKIGAAGVCRTDLHILEGQWESKSGVKLPYTIGHENAGWIHALGDAVTNMAVGDKVILHPLVTCGLCRACRFGDDVHCENSSFPGINVDGGYAEYMKTTARSVIKLDPSLEPADVAALADAGLTAYHAVAKAARVLRPGNVVVMVSDPSYSVSWLARPRLLLIFTNKDHQDRCRWTWPHWDSGHEGHQRSDAGCGRSQFCCARTGQEAGS